jgi:hypothetical protein
MKGLTHFISAIAATSFIPDVVRRCAAERTGSEGAEASFMLALAGLYGILPDTLDFKVGRFFETADVEVFPDVKKPDPQAMADALGKAMDLAWHENREVRIQFHPIRLSADKWWQYEIKFDTTQQEVIIVIGEVVTTSQIAFRNTAPEIRVGIYRLKEARLLPGSTRDSKVDIMSGPMYAFKVVKGYLTVDFLPWHRTWSHSYTLGAVFALPLWGIAAFFGWHDPWLYALVAFLGFSTHITEDLTGFLGGSLIWPFIKERTKGLCLFHANNPDSNFITDFLAVILIIFNLDRFTVKIIPFSFPLYFLIFFILPVALYLAPRYLKQPQKELISPQNDSAKELIDAYRARMALAELEDEDDSEI